MQFLYVLTTTGNDEYVNMTYLSALLLHKNHPSSKIVIACDNQSAKSLKESKHALLELANEIIECQTPDGKPSWRNRYVKCRMRKLIKGDFLYLDGDTLPVKPLDQIFNLSESFAAASNHSKSIQENFRGYEIEMFREMGWKIPEENYVNGGVLFWKDNDDAHKLSDIYIKKWEESSKGNKHYDQPPLNAALTEWNGEYYLLENKFNAQFRANIKVGIDASVWHFYYSDYTETIRDYYSIGLQMLQKNQKINADFIKNVTCARIPFETKSKRAEEKLINLINRKGSNITNTEYYLSQGRYLLYLRAKFLKK